MLAYVGQDSMKQNIEVTQDNVPIFCKVSLPVLTDTKNRHIYVRAFDLQMTFKKIISTPDKNAAKLHSCQNKN